MKQAKYFILTAQDLQGCKQKYAIRHIDRIFVVCYIKSSGFKLVDLIEQRWHMAKRIAGVTEKLLECAKEEFMRNGYESASLRVIAEKAGSSKGAIYIRYPDKESLYRSLVQPAMDDFCGLIQSTLEQFNQLPGAEQTSQMYSFSDQGFGASVDYIYDHFRFLYKGIIIKHNKTEPTYTKTSLFLCEKRRFFMAWTEKGVVTTI